MADNEKMLEGSEDYLRLIEENLSTMQEIRSKIRTLEVELPKQDQTKTIVPSQPASHPSEMADFCDSIENFELYLSEYTKFSGSTAEELALILPNKDDYHYEDVLLRLHAESLKIIKEVMEYSYEDATVQEDAKKIVARERQKIEFLQQLLSMEEEISEDEPEFNKIVLVPNVNGNIKLFDELETIPLDYYPEVYQLIGTIIKGTFKRLKRLGYGTNSNLIGGVTEVRGAKIRVLFQRLNYDTYAVFSVFMKKTTNDNGLQHLLRNRIGEYKEVEDKLRENLSNPDFMDLNEQYLLELWRKLGYEEAPKIYRKDIS